MTARPPPSIRTLPDIIQTKAEENGDSVFLQFKDETITFAELDVKTDQIAAGFQRMGVESGEQVCLYMYNSIPYVLAYFALAKLGAVVIPIDTRFSGDTLSYVLSITEAETILVDEQTRSAYEAVREEELSLTDELFVGGSSHTYRDFETVREADPADFSAVPVRASDTVSITFVQQYTAEVPQGIMLPHYSPVLGGWEVSENLFGYGPDDRLFTTLPLYSIFTFNYGVMGALVGDARVQIHDPFDPETFWKLVDQHDASIILYLGRMLSVLYNQKDTYSGGGNPVELAIGHGFSFGTDERLIENFEAHFDVTVFEGYGITDTGGFATYNTPSAHRAGSSGRPVSHVNVRVVDEQDYPVETGETGEIVVRSTEPNTMLQGQYKSPEDTVQLCRNQWVHTGDLGYFDDDGYLYFVANEENSIYRGQLVGRISSLEIESVVEAYPTVEQSAVIGVETDVGNEEIMAIVVPAKEDSLNPMDVCQHCDRNLPRVKVPRYIAIRDELPRTSTGSVDKEQLEPGTNNDVWDRERGYELSR